MCQSSFLVIAFFQGDGCCQDLGLSGETTEEGTLRSSKGHYTIDKPVSHKDGYVQEPAKKPISTQGQGKTTFFYFCTEAEEESSEFHT